MLPTSICSTYSAAQVRRNNHKILRKVAGAQKLNARFPAFDVPLPYKVAQAQRLAAGGGVASEASSSSSSSSSPSSSSSRTPTLGRPHVFQASQNPRTLRWRPAQYSNRRTMQVVQAALEEGRLDEVPNCPQKSEILAKLQREEEATEGVNTSSFQLTREQLKTPTTPQEQRDLIAKIATAKGPYVGRSVKRIGLKRFFKGTIGERTRNKKDKKIAANMENMDSTVAEWRKINAQNRAKARPAQPF